MTASGDVPAIRLDGVGKRFRQYRDEAMLVKRVLRLCSSRVHHELWALKDLDLEVGRGETIGVIGNNGSGKTTLLRVLSGISAPSVGTVEVRGRQAALVGIGVGFNRELTGRENVDVNGRLLGMSPDQIAERFDRIVAFSELEHAIDVPVKFYSSGMFLRLAFSIAIHTDPDVMLVDEILAVGDVAFQTKCFDRMGELQASGTTIVVVTHNLQILQRLAPRTIVLDRGEMAFDGPTTEALRVYHEVMQRDAAAREVPAYLPAEMGGSVGRRVATIRPRILDEHGDSVLSVPSHRPLRVALDVDFDEELTDPIVGLAIERPGLGLLFATSSAPGAYTGSHGPGHPLSALVELGDLPLLAGTYGLRAVVLSPDQKEPVGASAPLLFHVDGDGLGDGTVAMVPSIWIDDAPVRVQRWSLGDDGEDGTAQDLG